MQNLEMKKVVTIFACAITLLFACKNRKMNAVTPQKKQKAVVYQVFTRLFGNKNTNFKPWGTLEENGVGKFNDFTEVALKEINKLGVTHIWYTGVLHHAVINDYSKYGIPQDDPDVVKGRAGSPYAIKDYYNVNPDLAIDPSKRLEEFEALIKRTHGQNMKVIIDIVPNHVARNYHSISLPEGEENFGASDDTSVEYKRDNNFYYIPGEHFKTPTWINGYMPLGGKYHPRADSSFKEYPAKWTGNGSRNAQPDFYDWYETVKVNYGIKPDGSKDFDTLPHDFHSKGYKEHFAFWEDKSVPDSWIKFKNIALFWLEKGVDGFRYDMAEMVPVEFWSYMNSAIKMQNPDAFLLAEVYNPSLYRDYINLGKMDYLYDKVELYDTLKHIIQGQGSTDNIVNIQNNLADIEHQMLHFLENHDEQRIASPEFAGDANKGKPMMVLSATISSSPTMIYFGQECGEKASDTPGFGSASRTSIFDYWGVPSHQGWMNNGKFDGGGLNEEEKELRDFYKRILNFSKDHPALLGHYQEIHDYNRHNTSFYTDKLYTYARWKGENRLIIVCNFSNYANNFELKLPPDLVEKWQIKQGITSLKDELYGNKHYIKHDSIARIPLYIKPFESLILSF